MCPEGSRGKRADAQMFKWSTKSTFIFNYVLLTQVIYGYVLLETLMIKFKCNFFPSKYGQKDKEKMRLGEKESKLLPKQGASIS